MSTCEEYLSPDGVLRLLIIGESDDPALGFDGYSWHTHGEVIARELELLGEPGVAPDDAARRFVDDLLAGGVLPWGSLAAL